MRRLSVAWTCLFVSILINSGILLLIQFSATETSAASPPPALIRSGTSFADMVSGALNAAPPQHVETSEPSELTEAARPVDAPQVDLETTEAQRAQPSPEAISEMAEPSSAALVLRPDEQTTSAADVMASTTAAEITSIAPSQAAPIAQATISPQLPQPLEPVDRAAEPNAVDASTAEPLTLTAVEPQTLEALPDVDVQEVTSDTVRPPRRPDTLGQTPPPPPAPAVTQQRTTQAPSGGGAQQNTTRGQVAPSQPQAQASQQGQGQQAEAAAAATARAVAAYPNAVMRQVRRSQNARSNIRGVATIGLQIGRSGEVASVRLLRSSGNAELDRIALEQIRRSGPYPPPPPGARTAYPIEVQGRR